MLVRALRRGHEGQRAPGQTPGGDVGGRCPLPIRRHHAHKSRGPGAAGGSGLCPSCLAGLREPVAAVTCPRALLFLASVRPVPRSSLVKR